MLTNGMRSHTSRIQVGKMSGSAEMVSAGFVIRTIRFFMKLTRCTHKQANRGSALLIVMGVTLVLGIALAAVLSLTTHENRVLARTMTWNAALPVAEAGIEEAMSHLRQVDRGARDVNGWSPDGSSVVRKRFLSNGWYVVGISSADYPDIISSGKVWCPSAGRYIKRTVQVTTVGQGLHNMGLVAKRSIRMTGTFNSDSFDSTKPELSTNGQYDPSKRSDNGDVGTILSVPEAMKFGGSVHIYGSVATGPEGTITMNNSTSIGSETWVDGGKTGIESDHYDKDMNINIPDATLPYTNSGATPVNGIVGGINYKYILQDGVDYRLSTLKLSSAEKMLVRGKARLVVDEDVSITGEAFIQIATNASLEVHVVKEKISISGAGIMNPSGNAANFGIYGLPGVTAVSITGDGTFIGTVYAPQANLKLAGGGTDHLDFVGAAIVNSATGRGSFGFHYDESLKKRNPKLLVITSWKEIQLP